MTSSESRTDAPDEAVPRYEFASAESGCPSIGPRIRDLVRLTVVSRAPSFAFLLLGASKAGAWLVHQETTHWDEQPWSWWALATLLLFDAWPAFVRGITRGWYWSSDRHATIPAGGDVQFVAAARRSRLRDKLSALFVLLFVAAQMIRLRGAVFFMPVLLGYWSLLAVCACMVLAPVGALVVEFLELRDLGALIVRGFPEALSIDRIDSFRIRDVEAQLQKRPLVGGREKFWDPAGGFPRAAAVLMLTKTGESTLKRAGLRPEAAA